jgi:ceramide glucosyltransferase
VQQRYPEFEVLFGAQDANDPAVSEVRRLQREFPEVPIGLVIGGGDTPNGKVGVLMELAKKARHPVWVVNDSDIRVDPSYLAEVVGPLADPAIGVVTCPYRVEPHNAPAAWEALGIMSDFMPSTLVAQLIGVREFGFGSTLAFWAIDLEQAGGFAAIAGFLADDYHLAKRLTASGRRALLSTYTVETALAGATWRGIWQHQVRWARTVRASKGRGYTGLPVTHAGLWALVACCFGAWRTAGVLVITRVLSAFLSTRGVLRSYRANRVSRVGIEFLAPLWDLYAFCVWIASYTGADVRWRDQILRIDSEGRIRELRALPEDAC